MDGEEDGETRDSVAEISEGSADVALDVGRTVVDLEGGSAAEVVAVASALETRVADSVG